MSVSAAAIIQLNVTETVGTDAAGYASSNRNSVQFTGGRKEETLTGSTTPAVTTHAVGAQALSAGAATIDLRTLTGLNGVAVDLNGLKPRYILLHNTGANSMTAAKGASNGYTGLGSAASIEIKAGCRALIEFGENGTAVSNTVKTLDVTGTGAQVLKYQIVAGS